MDYRHDWRIWSELHVNKFHGDGVHSLGISERMTLANLASEMGAKNASFHMIIS